MLKNVSYKRECPPKWSPHRYGGISEAGFIVSQRNLGREYQNVSIFFMPRGGGEEEVASVRAEDSR